MKKIIRVTTISGSFLSLLEGQLKFMSNHFEIIAVGSNGGKIKNENIIDIVAKKEKIKAIPVEMTRKITPYKDFLAVKQLYKIFKEEKPDIVHSHTPKAGTLAMVAAKLAKVPCRLHTIAGLPLVEVTGNKRRLLNFVEKITYRFATKIYPNSLGLKKIILDNNFTTENKLKVLGNGSSNGIDTNFFNPENISELQKTSLRKKLNIKKEDFVFIFLGRLVKDKGINELIKAFKKLNNSHKNIKLLLLGAYENGLDPLLPETNHEITNNSNILMQGWITDVRPYLAISDVLTFPSYREGFPNTVMQACAMNVLCIVSNINGCNEIIKDQKNGIVIPVKSAEALNNAMETVLLDSDLRTKLTTESRVLIKKKYERNFVWKEILNEYNLLLSKNV